MDTSTEQGASSQPGIASEPNSTTVTAPNAPPAAIEAMGPPGWLATVALCLLISVASSAISIWWYDRKYATKIVSVDLKGYLEKQTADFVAGKATQEDIQKGLLQIGDLVKKVSPNTAVITSDVAVRNIETLKP